MANSYFRFKQFLVEQDKASMKVTTDACLFGSLFSTLIQKDEPSTVLDIGTGTGLLSLMYAQQFRQAHIDALDIDEHAFEQASKNISASPWNDRIHTICADVTEYQAGKKYDVIMCNPPFYENDLKSPDVQRNKALHDSHLTLAGLFKAIKLLLREEGTVLVLLPYHRAAQCKKIAMESGLFCNEEVLAKQTTKHSWFRSIMKFSTENTTTNIREITIKIDDEYSPQFARLLSPFYLAL